MVGLLTERRWQVLLLNWELEGGRGLRAVEPRAEGGEAWYGAGAGAAAGAGAGVVWAGAACISAGVDDGPTELSDSIVAEERLERKPLASSIIVLISDSVSVPDDSKSSLYDIESSFSRPW